MAFVYPAGIREQGRDFVVTVRDLPEVVTSGDTLEQALDLAADAIEVAVASRMERDLPLPVPSRSKRGEHPVSLPRGLRPRPRSTRPGSCQGCGRPISHGASVVTRSRFAGSSTLPMEPSSTSSTKPREP